MATKITDMNKYVEERYTEAIKYYWTSSRNNKRWFKVTRLLTVVIGAIVTLVSSLLSSKFIADDPAMLFVLTIGTPILSATLAILAGFSQSFQWGSAWQNGVMTAQRLQKEYDLYLVTDPKNRDYSAELAKLNTFVITESEGFFNRLLGNTSSDFKKHTIPVHMPNNESGIEKN